MQASCPVCKIRAPNVGILRQSSFLTHKTGQKKRKRPRLYEDPARLQNDLLPRVAPLLPLACVDRLRGLGIVRLPLLTFSSTSGASSARFLRRSHRGDWYHATRPRVHAPPFCSGRNFSVPFSPPPSLRRCFASAASLLTIKGDDGLLAAGQTAAIRAF